MADISKLAKDVKADSDSTPTSTPRSGANKKKGGAAAAKAQPPQSPAQSAALPHLSRFGLFAFFKDFESAKRGLEPTLELFPKDNQFQEPVHILYLAFRWVYVPTSSSLSSTCLGLVERVLCGVVCDDSQKLPADEQMSSHFRTFLKSHEKLLETKGIRRVTFIATLKDGNTPTPLLDLRRVIV